MEKESDKTGKKVDTKFKPGEAWTGNASGRPPGTISILTDLKQRLRKLKEEDPDTYLSMIDDYWRDKKKRQLLIQMIDGLPKQSVDHSGGITVTPIYGGKSALQGHDSDPKDISTQ